MQFVSENDNLVRNRRSIGIHSTEELLAQSVCQAYASQRNLYGRVYAVGRRCPDPWYNQLDTCTTICASPYLHVQDSQTARGTWSCINAYHIYSNRPATTSHGQQNNAKLGLKSKQEGCNTATCGPNYCCCYAS